MRKIIFENIPTMENEGVRSKTHSGPQFSIRIVEFSENFVEEDWCKKGHVGYVLEGSMKIAFKDEILTYQKGDGIYIDANRADSHKAILEEGQSVKLVLFEEN